MTQLDSVAAGRPRALEAATLCEAFQLAWEDRATDPALRLAGEERWIAWGEYAERVRSIAGGLAALGVARGDTIGLMLANRPEFHLCDCAALHLGATPFSIYTTSVPEDLEYVLDHAASTVAITERQFVDRVLAVKDRLPELRAVVVVDGAVDGAMTLEELEAGASSEFDFEASWRAVEPDDVVTLIYTSGTTGKPKGVQLTHANILAEARAVDAVLPASRGRLISFLPPAHIADRLQSQYCAMIYGHQVTCCPDPRAVASLIPQVRPTFLLTIPPLWEALKGMLETSFAAEPDLAKKEAVQRALELGVEKVRLEQAGEPVPDELAEQYARADEEVLSAIREQIGFGELEFAVVGAAPMARDVMEFLGALGLVPLEVFGMSEAAAIVTVNPPDAPKFGTVGKALPGVEVQTAADGELLIRGPTVMKGYRNMLEKTAEAISADGWLHTGDVAEIDDDGYVKILYRKKDLIINAAGQPIVPAKIEGALRLSGPLIGQAVAIGDNRSYTSVLIVLDPDAVPAFAQEAGIEDTSPAALAVNASVLAEVDRCVAAANAHLTDVEQITKYAVLPTQWRPGGEEMTPTMKIKRGAVSEKYAAEIDALYA